MIVALNLLCRWPPNSLGCFFCRLVDCNFRLLIGRINDFSRNSSYQEQQLRMLLTMDWLLLLLEQALRWFRIFKISQVFFIPFTYNFCGQAMLVLSSAHISGGHLNPAVTAGCELQSFRPILSNFEAPICVSDVFGNLQLIVACRCHRIAH